MKYLELQLILIYWLRRYAGIFEENILNRFVSVNHINGQQNTFIKLS